MLVFLGICSVRNPEQHSSQTVDSAHVASDADGPMGDCLYFDGTSAQLRRSFGRGTSGLINLHGVLLTYVYPKRFFLGATEAGLFPGVVYYLSCWYKRKEQHFRISIFFSAASLAGR